MLFVVFFIVLCALIALEYCVVSSVLVFEAVILFSYCLLLSLFYGSHCVRVLCLVLGLWCLKR